ncbi:hypothetical protein PHJA_002485400 [Phtheirospermum japonicum]|uniref:Uncharacterized protein n=1 Tax=Phtheirospermum japonicum TaxID=374723 RepID=A0A830D8C4_9LAMI|nr:hypothetical protein PHJA_002485400 [Phtheirospermum japonicum]
MAVDGVGDNLDQAPAKAKTNWSNDLCLHGASCIQDPNSTATGSSEQRLDLRRMTATVDDEDGQPDAAVKHGGEILAGQITRTFRQRDAFADEAEATSEEVINASIQDVDTDKMIVAADGEDLITVVSIFISSLLLLFLPLGMNCFNCPVTICAAKDGSKLFSLGYGLAQVPS